MAAMAKVRIAMKLTVAKTVLAFIPNPFFICPLSQTDPYYPSAIDYNICIAGKKEPSNSKGDTAFAIPPNALGRIKINQPHMQMLFLLACLCPAFLLFMCLTMFLNMEASFL